LVVAETSGFENHDPGRPLLGLNIFIVAIVAGLDRVRVVRILAAFFVGRVHDSSLSHASTSRRYRQVFVFFLLFIVIGRRMLLFAVRTILLIILDIGTSILGAARPRLAATCSSCL
jgi:branched-subunit amino acid ABC-type transport system permease component